MANTVTSCKRVIKKQLLSATNIILIGFMGSGKSSVGRLLATQDKRSFMDTDSMIEQNEGMSISEIFDRKGEAYFRRLEEESVSWLKDNIQNAVISTGGGMLVHCEGLKEVGEIVYLRVPFSTILQRMSQEELEKRPLFKDIKTAEALYNERDKVYEQKADVIVDADTDINAVLARLRDAIS